MKRRDRNVVQLRAPTYWLVAMDSSMPIQTTSDSEICIDVDGFGKRGMTGAPQKPRNWTHLMRSPGSQPSR